MVGLAIFDVATGRALAQFENVGSNQWFGSSLPPPEYALSADGSTLAFTRIRAEQVSEVIVWDVSTERLLAEFPGSPPLALSRDGARIAYSGPGPTDDLPTVRTLRMASIVPSPVDRDESSRGMCAGPLAFSPDGERLVRVTREGQPSLLNCGGLSGPSAISQEVNNESAEKPAGRHRWFSPQAVWFGRGSSPISFWV